MAYRRVFLILVTRHASHRAHLHYTYPVTVLISLLQNVPYVFVPSKAGEFSSVCNM